MGMRALPLSSHHLYQSPPTTFSSLNTSGLKSNNRVSTTNGPICTSGPDLNGGGEEEESKKKNKQSLFGSITEALDFSQVRSSEDAQLSDKAGQMTKEQYGALRRKINGTYKDFF